jgi:hypothetical protein
MALQQTCMEEQQAGANAHHPYTEKQLNGAINSLEAVLEL